MFSWFESLVKPFPPEPPDTPPKSLLAFCLHYTRGSKLYLVMIAMTTAATALLEVSLFRFLGKLVDRFGQSTPDTFLLTYREDLIFMALVILVALPVSVLLHSLLLHQAILGNFPMRIRWQAHRYLLNQSIAFYQNEFAGRIATKVMQTALAVRESVLKLLDVLLYVLIYFSAVIFVCASLDLVLVLPLLMWLLIYAGLLHYFLPRLETISSRQADARSEMTGRIVDTYTNIVTVKLFSHVARESDYARAGMDKFLATVHPQMRLATALSVSVWLSNALLIFTVSAQSIWLWTEQAISTGAIATAIGLVLRMYGMSQWVMWEISGLFENIGTARDGMNTLAIEQEVTDQPQAKALQVQHGAIRFDRVRFNYGKPNGLFDEFSLAIQPGEKIGLVGRSGAGKSTLVNLLLRFYDVDAGAIYIDDQDIQTVTQSSLRAQISMVTQDTSLLHRSIRQNLVYSNPDASEQTLQHAVEQARAHEFIDELVDMHGNRGFEAMVGERGVKLSGGQRQRIAIARVLLKNAPILILDEATSALDSEVEAAIQENLYKLMEGKTVIAIAHRLSTIAALDRLIVLDKGKIIEQGTHRQLVNSNGLYAHLWEHQSGGFLGEN